MTGGNLGCNQNLAGCCRGDLITSVTTAYRSYDACAGPHTGNLVVTTSKATVSYSGYRDGTVPSMLPVPADGRDSATVSLHAATTGQSYCSLEKACPPNCHYDPHTERLGWKTDQWTRPAVWLERSRQTANRKVRCCESQTNCTSLARPLRLELHILQNFLHWMKSCAINLVTRLEFHDAQLL